MVPDRRKMGRSWIICLSNNTSIWKCCSIRKARKKAQNIVSAISKYGDTVAKFFIKYGDEIIEAVYKFGDDAVSFLMNFGDKAGKLLKNMSVKGMELVKKFGQDIVIKFVSLLGDAKDAFKFFSKHGDDGEEILELFAFFSKKGDVAPGITKAFREFFERYKKGNGDIKGFKLLLKDFIDGLEFFCKNLKELPQLELVDVGKIDLNEYGEWSEKVFKKLDVFKSRIDDFLAGASKNADEVVSSAKIVKETPLFVEYLNKAGNKIRITKQAGKTIDNSIVAKLTSSDVGVRTESKVAYYIKNTLGIDLTDFGNKVKDSTGQTIGDIDCATKNVLIEVKASISSAKVKQFYKYVDDTINTYMNVENKKVLLYVDQTIDMTDPQNVQKLNELEKMGVIVVNGLEELKGIIN